MDELKITIERCYYSTIICTKSDSYCDLKVINNTWLGPFFEKSPETMKKHINKAKKEIKSHYEVINEANKVG